MLNVFQGILLLTLIVSFIIFIRSQNKHNIILKIITVAIVIGILMILKCISEKNITGITFYVSEVIALIAVIPKAKAKVEKIINTTNPQNTIDTKEETPNNS